MSGRGYQGSKIDQTVDPLNYNPLRAYGRSVTANSQFVRRHDANMFRDPLAHMNRTMQEVDRAFAGEMMRMPDLNQMPVDQSYSYEGVRCYDNSRGGRPRLYEETYSTRQGLGGVKETQGTVIDSESGVQKMAIGHHINDRGHVIERSLNPRTNEFDDQHHFYGLNEYDAEAFDQEWTNAARRYLKTPASARAIDDGRRRLDSPRRAIDDGRRRLASPRRSIDDGGRRYRNGLSGNRYLSN